ncbi:speract receptor-like [Saccoglossus kowalevskii]|uniref:guanylate cyclase n=1 Tax=Saccoglossus kowalevskii TaxID=10224 RepID=A0ABM0MPH8_SACKO|nr:PREDICTED: speract receptor-like [Saccoglossus kowalevskii]
MRSTSTVLKLALFVTFVACWSASAQSTNITVGFLIPMSDPNSLVDVNVGQDLPGAFDFAVDMVNKYVMGSDYQITYEWKDTYYETNMALMKIGDWWKAKYPAIVGPGTSCSYEARFASSLNIPLIDYLCEDESVEDKDIFTTYLRYNPPGKDLAYVIVKLMESYGWQRCSVINSDAPAYQSVANTLFRLFDEHGIEVTNKRSFPGDFDPDKHNVDFRAINLDWNIMLNAIAQTTRIYVFIGTVLQSRDFMITLKKRGLLADGLVQDGTSMVISTSMEHKFWGLAQYAKGSYTDAEDDTAFKAMKNLIIVESQIPSGDVSYYNGFVDAYLHRSETKFGTLPYGSRNSLRGFYLFDAMWQVGNAINRTIENGEDLYDGKTFISHLMGEKFSGLATALGLQWSRYTDEHGVTHSDIDVKSWRLYDSFHHLLFGRNYEEVITVGVDMAMLPAMRYTLDPETGDWIIDETALELGITWPTSNGEPPLDMPTCGFFNEHCPDVVTPAASAGSVVFVLCVTLIIVYFYSSVFHMTKLNIACYTFFFRRHKYEAELDSLVWKIDFEEVKLRGGQTTSRGGISIKSMMMSTLSIITNQEQQQIFAKTGTYRDLTCAIKPINKHHIDLTRSIRQELKMMRDMRHDNIAKFIGASVDRPHICILMEYCAKGSLQDILENDSIQLDNLFKASFIADLMKGMVYIHSSEIRSHGNLKSSNCVVNNRWMLKITDYGLHEIKKGQLEEDAGEYAYYSNLLWRAPEHLREGKAMTLGGSLKGDVYSFAMILQEIYTRAQPFHMNDEEPKGIVEKLIIGGNPPYRPDISDITEDVAPKCIIEAMQVCWAEDPLDRPSFLKIKEMLHPLQKGLKPNIMDNMIAIMERYSNQLEEIVDEKTSELRHEKTKVKSLLLRLLPQSIASQLIKGVSVLPQSYDMVSLFFSDICGFTALSAASTPIQVVNMLNDMYTAFDAIISNYDVYKVETIGDAYMLVSGLPLKNGINHAGQIASTAWHLLGNIQSFKVRHMPDKVLEMRIGIHSGPCVAGVVGDTMPRYCLFGDTVQTGARYESNGKPMKVHVSPECKKVLDQIGGYDIEERGLVDMGGKVGEVTTYWMNGQDPSYKIEKAALPEQKTNE